MSRRASSAPAAVPPPSRRPIRRRSLVSLLVVACLVVGVVAAFGRDLVQDLVSGALAEPTDAGRPLSAAEAQRLASMRRHNWDDGQARVRATIGRGGEQVHAVGWVDWRHPMVYLALSGDQPGVISELVQAVPGLVATRPESEPPAAPTAEIVDPHPPPPVEPPADGWQVRLPGAAGPPGAAGAPGSIDTLVALLLTTGAGGTEQTGETDGAADLLARSEARWLRRDRTAGYEVDVLLGPAVPPAPASSPANSPPSSTARSTPAPSSPPPSLAEMGGAVQYWLDDRARLHRLEALLAADTPVRVDLDRTDRTTPDVLDLLGGAAIDPRPLTGAEVELLAELPLRNRSAGGGEVTLRLPVAQDTTVRAAGWLDWQQTIAYLARVGQGDSAAEGLLWADQSGVASRPAPPSDQDGLPPLPAPPEAGWERSAWEERADEYGGFDLDLLINEALALSGWDGIDADLLRERAQWLRSDEVSGAGVAVYELPREFETGLAPGQARMRYWVDESGVLRRVEIRTRTGGFGQLDLSPGPVPYLGSVAG